MEGVPITRFSVTHSNMEQGERIHSNMTSEHPEINQRRRDLHAVFVSQGDMVKIAWRKAYQLIPKACDLVKVPSTTTPTGVHVNTFVPMPGTFHTA